MLDLHLRRNLSFSEDSDLSCDDVLERSSQKSKADVSRCNFYGDFCFSHIDSVFCLSWKHVSLFELLSDLNKHVRKQKGGHDKAKKRQGKVRSKAETNEKVDKRRIKEMSVVKMEKDMAQDTVKKRRYFYRKQ